MTDIYDVSLVGWYLKDLASLTSCFILLGDISHFSLWVPNMPCPLHFHPCFQQITTMEIIFCLHAGKAGVSQFPPFDTFDHLIKSSDDVSQ